MKKQIHLGLLGAMPEEVSSALEYLEIINEEKFGDLKIYTGKWAGKVKNGTEIILSLAWSGWGKVSSARAASRLIGLKITNYPKISKLIFCGVAGAVKSNLKQWDIVIPEKLIQHDMDASPIFDKYVIPALKTKYLESDKKLVNWSYEILNQSIKQKKLKGFGNIYKGLVGTGDRFISSNSEVENLRKDIDELFAVEMEGAAVAQVAIQENIQWLIIRVISDSSNNEANQSFSEFIKIYNKVSSQIIYQLIENIN